MACLFCRKKIGPLRKLVDANFCCADHRKKYRAHSARSLREAEDLYGAGDEWSERWRLYSHKTPNNKQASHSQGSVFVVAVAVAFLLFAVSREPAGESPPPNRSSDQSPSSSEPGGLQRRIGEVIEKHAPVTIRESFHTGLGQWDSEPGRIRADAKWGDWSFEGGYVRPGSLRLWKNSESLANYDLEFVGHVEKRSMDWAFRAVDFQNYYATKLTVASEGKSGSYSNAGLVRYAVIDGKERDRVELPLPITLERDTDYRVKVSIRGSRFLTSIDGQLVSSWIDNRISRGGVGLFSDAGESSAFKWLSVSERDSFWGRLASHFSLLTFPALPPDSALSR